MNGHEIASPVMMQLGSFQFGIATAAYQELRRSSEWRWAAQERFGKIDALQFTGPGVDTITMPGVIYPEWRGGVGQVDDMRAMASDGLPLALVAGDGASMGRWVILRVEEGKGVFAAAGVARRVEFTLELKRFADADPAAPIVSLPGAGGGVPAAAVPTSATSPASQVKGLAGSVASSARSLSATLAKASEQVQQHVAPYAAIGRDALGAVSRSLGVVGELQGVANAALTAIGLRPFETNILLHADNMAARANRALVNAQSASAVLRTSSDKLGRLSNVTPEATRAMQSAQAAADRTVTLTRQVATQAATIKGQTNG